VVQIPAKICGIAHEHEPVTCPQTLRGTLPAICATPSTEKPIAAALTAAMNSPRLSRARCRSSFNSFVRILLCSRNFLYHFGCLPQRAGRGGRVRNVQPSLRSVGHNESKKVPHLRRSHGSPGSLAGQAGSSFIDAPSPDGLMFGGPALYSPATGAPTSLAVRP
jgi:hypothetical protein